jgi:hypothetical protein
VPKGSSNPSNASKAPILRSSRGPRRPFGGSQKPCGDSSNPVEPVEHCYRLTQAHEGSKPGVVEPVERFERPDFAHF